LKALNDGKVVEELQKEIAIQFATQLNTKLRQALVLLESPQ
jgi:hypothetical protein